MKTTRLILVIAFLFVSFASFAQTRTTVISAVPSGNLVSTESAAQYNASAGLGLRSMVFPSNSGFYWGADLVAGMTFMRGQTAPDWLNQYPHSRGLIYASLQVPLGYGWTDKIGGKLNFFIGGGPTFRARFETVRLQLGLFGEAGFTTKTSEKIGLFVSARFSMYSMTFTTIPLVDTGLTDSELAILFGIKWDRTARP